MSAVTVIDSLLREAYTVQASDIHLDPGAGTFIARFRVDGILYDAQRISPHLEREILARLKILAGLRTDEHQAPQDGRFRFEISSEVYIDVRISITPTYHGENAVLRLLTSSSTLTSLSSLGLDAHQEALLQETIRHPHGLILITGPTGSGKTSTLYALIQLLNTRSSSIITIEDPVEYAIDGINQIPANPRAGLSFAQGLRSILRQDPNIICIGEIRDSETAALAVNAALTGHLVLSTLHTTNAPTAIPRLIDMGVEPYLLSSTVRLVVSQRLIRRLCISCRRQKPLESARNLTSSISQEIPLVCDSTYESLGCDACGGTGRLGRVGIFELMQMSTLLREAISRRAATQEITTIAHSEGMQSLIHDGLRKVSDGIVSMEEICAFAT